MDYWQQKSSYTQGINITNVTNKNIKNNTVFLWWRGIWYHLNFHNLKAYKTLDLPRHCTATSSFSEFTENSPTAQPWKRLLNFLQICHFKLAGQKGVGKTNRSWIAIVNTKLQPLSWMKQKERKCNIHTLELINWIPRTTCGFRDKLANWIQDHSVSSWNNWWITVSKCDHANSLFPIVNWKSLFTIEN